MSQVRVLHNPGLGSVYTFCVLGEGYVYIFFLKLTTWTEGPCFQFILRYWLGSNKDVHSKNKTTFLSFPFYPASPLLGGCVKKNE